LIFLAGAELWVRDRPKVAGILLDFYKNDFDKQPVRELIDIDIVPTTHTD